MTVFRVAQRRKERLVQQNGRRFQLWFRHGRTTEMSLNATHLAFDPGENVPRGRGLVGGADAFANE